jgi:uncharacterized protein (UPF0335 family)
MAKTRTVIGDNSIDGEVLKGFVERLERLDEEKQSILDDMKDVKGEAKNKGLDTKTLDRILKLRRQDKEIRRAEREMLDAYLAALGME